MGTDKQISVKELGDLMEAADVLSERFQGIFEMQTLVQILELEFCGANKELPGNVVFVVTREQLPHPAIIDEPHMRDGSRMYWAAKTASLEEAWAIMLGLARELAAER